MAKKNESERYGEWSKAIIDSEKYLADRSQDWDKFLKYYRQDISPEEFGGDTVWINYQFYFSRIILPSIYFRNPDIMVRPRRQDPIEYIRAKTKDHLLTYQIEEMNFEDEMRRVIFDALYAWGVMKFGYGPVLWSKKRKRTGEFDEGTLEALFESDDIDEPIIETRPKEESDDRISEYNPFAIRVSPRYWHIDPLASGLHDARWVGHTVVKTIDEVRNSKIYSRNLTSGIEGTHKINDSALVVARGEASGLFRSEKDADLVLLYEIWDKVENKLIVMDSYNMVKGDKKFLREETNPYDIEGFPFEILVFNNDPDIFGGVADTLMWENPAEAMNLINSMHYNHVKRFTRKYAARKNSIDAVEMDKLTSPIDGVIIQTNGDPREVGPHPISDAPLAPDSYNLRETLRNELMSITGITEGKRGSISRAKTATEAAELAQQSQIRDSDRLYLVSKFVERAARKILQLDRQFLDQEYIAFVTSPDEAMFWTMDHKAILNTEVDIRVRVGSSAYVSREVKTKQLLDAFNLAAGLINPMTGMPYVNIQEFLSRIFENLDIDNYASLFNQMMPPAGLPPGSPASPSPDMQASVSPQQMGGGPLQSPKMRGGAVDLGSILSGVQNLGVRRGV